jgi:hypothetical protein
MNVMIRLSTRRTDKKEREIEGNPILWPVFLPNTSLKQVKHFRVELKLTYIKHNSKFTFDNLTEHA